MPSAEIGAVVAARLAARTLDDFPNELKELRRWVTWRSTSRVTGKATKKPQQSVSHPHAWLSLADASERVARGDAQGVGFVLGERVVGLDLDGCIAHDGTLHEMALDALKLGTYAETSPSGRGLHLFIRATISKPRNIRARADVPGREIYDGREGSARYFTVTGKRIGHTKRLAEGPQAQAALDGFIAKWFPEECPVPDVATERRASEGAAEEDLSDDSVLSAMFGAEDGAKWHNQVFDGDYSTYPSQSEADLALCRKLRFFTRGNAAQMDRLFRRSGLMRGKWDQQHGARMYGEHTIAKARTKGGPYYMPCDKRNDVAKRAEKERESWAKFPLWWVVRLQGAGELVFRVLSVIASYANTRTGEAFPSVATIAAHCRVSDRRVQKATSKLKELGILAITLRPRASNLYRLALRAPEIITPHATTKTFMHTATISPRCP